jgi:hypothetical protein
LDAAICRARPSGHEHRHWRVAHPDFFGENVFCIVHDYLGALDVAPVSLRSIDGFRLAPLFAAGLGEYFDHSDCFVGEKLTGKKTVLELVEIVMAFSLTPCFSGVLGLQGRSENCFNSFPF